MGKGGLNTCHGGGAGEGWVGGAERKHVPLERILVSFFKKASEVTVASNN